MTQLCPTHRPCLRAVRVVIIGRVVQQPLQADAHLQVAVAKLAGCKSGWAGWGPTEPQQQTHLELIPLFCRTVEFALEGAVPVVLDGIVSAARKELGDDCTSARGNWSNNHASLVKRQQKMSMLSVSGQAARQQRSSYSRAHLLPCSRCALMITASSHWLKGSFFTSGFSWLHHLARRECQRRKVEPSFCMDSCGREEERLLPLAAHLRRQLLPDRPRMPFAMMDQFLGPYSPMSWRNSSSSCKGRRARGQVQGDGALCSAASSRQAATTLPLSPPQSSKRPS